MKISAWHKANGDSVEWCLPMGRYDLVYQSKVFDETYSLDIDWMPLADKIIKGGTGYFRRKKDKTSEVFVLDSWVNIGNQNTYSIGNETYNELLHYEVEHTCPDYSIYADTIPWVRDTSLGFMTRGCPRGCEFCIVAQKEGRCSKKVADISEWNHSQPHINLFDPNILACKDHPDLLQQLVDSRAWVDFNQGLDIRLTNEQNIALINQVKVKEIRFAWDNANDDLKPYFEEYKRLAKHKPHGRYGTVYCLTNFGSTTEENLYRIYTLRDLGYDPYVMIYDKPNAPRDVRLLQRWCNNKIIFRSCERFEDYDPKKG
jgi:hypothetical protein